MTQLLNETFLNKRITVQQKQGILICLPKTQQSSTPDSYRPITLLNTEYKLLARIMATRLKPILAEQLSTGQYCGIQGRSIFDALATVRDVIAYHETTRTPLCLISLDFQQAFDLISHEYLFQVLERYGISQWYVERLQAMYEQMNTLIQVNSTLVGPIAISSGIRQGCPLSMCLYAMCVHPLVRFLEESLPGIKIGRQHLKTTIIAYDDDVSRFVTDPTNFTTVRHAINTYEKANGARLNPLKSNALAIAGWENPTTPLDIPFNDRIDILGVTFGPNIALSRADSWSRIIREVRAQARKSFARTLCLEQRIQYVIVCLLARIWFIAQTLMPTRAHAQQITTTCRWYIWQASIFRVPITTLQRPKHEGGWNLPNIELKCKTLLYNRIQINGATDGTVMVQLFHTWDIRTLIPNPPQINRIPKKLEHLQQYIKDMEYIPPPTQTESRHTFKRRIYSTLLQLYKNENPESEMRITRKNPTVIWKRVWRNLHNNGLTAPIKSVWYAAINDILPTHDRLTEIHLVPTNMCPRCNNPDSVLHRITDCSEGSVQWTWTKKKLGIILRTEPKHIPKEWTICPDIKLWPPQRQAAVIWIVANFVFYRLQNNRRLSLRDYIDFMKRARWKQIQKQAGQIQEDTLKCRNGTTRKETMRTEVKRKMIIPQKYQIE